MGFPCNQFANQEPGGNEEIKSFCSLTYKTTFPLFQKVDVKGPNAHPLFRFLCKQKKGLLNDDIKWNFTKFLVDSKGNVIGRFAPATAPLKLEQQIVELIKNI